MDKNIHFIINPNSGKKKGHQLYDYLLSLKKENYTLKISEFPGEAIAHCVNSIKEKATIIVSCGGDGTLQEIASQLVGSQIPLGIIPIGSGNGLARSLKIPFTYNKALAIIENNKSITIDVGKINNEYFFSNFGIGIDSEIINYFSNQQMRGFWGYIKSTFVSVIKFKPIGLKITHKNTCYNDTFFLCSIANSDQIGYDFSFSPQALLQDGLLNILLIKKFSYWGWMQYIYYFLTKSLKKFSKSITFDTKNIKIEFINNQSKCQLDGEIISLKENILQVSIKENGLRVLV